MQGDTYQVQSFPMFSCASMAHEMPLPNKQARQQNKLGQHMRAIGKTGSGQYKTSSINKHSEGQPLASPLNAEVSHVIR